MLLPASRATCCRTSSSTSAASVIRARTPRRDVSIERAALGVLIGAPPTASAAVCCRRRGAERHEATECCRGRGQSGTKATGRRWGNGASWTNRRPPAARAALPARPAGRPEHRRQAARKGGVSQTAAKERRCLTDNREGKAVSYRQPRRKGGVLRQPRRA